MQVSREMLKDIAAYKINAAAQASTDPIMAGKAQQLTGALYATRAQALGAAAARQAMLGQQQQGGQPGQAQPGGLDDFSDRAGKIIEFQMQGPQQTEARKQFQEATDAVRRKDFVLSSFDKVAQLNTLGNRIMSPIQTKGLVDAIRGDISAQLGKEEAGRFTKQDAEVFSAQMKNVLENGNTVAEKRANLNALLSRTMDPARFTALNPYGINPIRANLGRYDFQGRDQLAARSRLHQAPQQGNVQYAPNAGHLEQTK
jgi:hypothetical protein